VKKEHSRRQVNLACQGLITRNNNALELAHHFIPQGNLLFSRLQRYASFLGRKEQGEQEAPVIFRQGEAAQSLVYLLPFLMAFGATDQRIEEYSTVSISLMPGVEKFLNPAKTSLPCFLISSAYRPFVQSLGCLLGFRESELYYTPLNLDQYSINESEREFLKDLADEIINMPLLAWEKKPDSPLKNIVPEHIPYLQRMEAIFEDEIAGMQAGKILTKTTALAGNEKVGAVKSSLEKTGNPAEGLLYFGCSVLDAAALDWVKKSGGLAVSFNGDREAVRSAEIAVIAGTCVILAILCDTFFQQGKEGVLELIKNWDLHKIQTEKLKIHPSLIHELFSHEHESFPQLELVTHSNIERLIGESASCQPDETHGERSKEP